MQQIIGRTKEIKLLEELYNSGQPEFVAVHGRRRVGKTFLVRELFANRLAFYHTGLSPVELDDERTSVQQQIEAFYSSLSRYGYEGPMPKNWLQAFDALIALLEAKSRKRLVVFIDEMPWMDTARSGFVTAFEHFWNGWGAGQTSLMLIACGSATAWMTSKIINSHGGLFNRITCEIGLEPFTLKECELFYDSRGLSMDRYDQLQAYMIFGGIPYYLSLLRKGLSLSQNVDALCFSRRGQLRGEFNRLFSSLFVNPEANKNLIRLLHKRRYGMLRGELALSGGFKSGGGLSSLLNGLEQSGFVTSSRYYKGAKREVYYRLVDPFCQFYLTFIDQDKTNDPHFWSNNLTTGKLNAWRGLAFENTCFAHIAQIKAALGIAGVHAEAAPWRSKQTDDGAQIDMLIDRADRVVNICEMKYCNDDFVITSSYDRELRHKMALFAQETNCKKALHLTLITTYGLKHNIYWGRVQRLITMDDLFQ